MKVSVIMPTLNNGREQLLRAVQSVLAQTHAQIELVVVDGGSDDGSEELLRELEAAHPDIIHGVVEPPLGVYHALNRGLQLATGELVGTLHGNDLYVSADVVSRVVQAFAEQPELPFVYGDVHYFSPGGRCVRLYSGSERPCKALRYGIAPPHPSLFIRADLLRRLGGYREDYVVAGDFELFVRLMLVEGLRGVYLPMDMVGMSLGGLSTRAYNRLITNNIEKMRAMRDNGISRTGLGVLRRYFHNLIQ